MQYSVKNNSSAARIPEVGEPWAHKSNLDFVYIRVKDKVGYRFFEKNTIIDPNQSFFSISLKCGDIVYTRFESENTIIILQPETPIVFVPKFS